MTHAQWLAMINMTSDRVDCAETKPEVERLVSVMAAAPVQPWSEVDDLRIMLKQTTRQIHQSNKTWKTSNAERTIHAACYLDFCVIQCSQKIPPTVFWHFPPNGWEFFNQILHACYMFPSTFDYKFLFNYLQLWRSLCHIKRDHPVHIIRAKCPPSTETHASIFRHFSQTVGNFQSKFYTPITVIGV